MGDIKLRYRLLILCILISIGPVLAVGTYSYLRAGSLLQEQARGSLMTTVAKTETYVIARAENTHNLLGMIAFGTTVTEPLNRVYADSFTLKENLDEFLNPFFYITIGQSNSYKSAVLYTDNKLPAYGPNIRPISEIQDEPRIAPALALSSPYWYCAADEVIVSQRIFDFSSYGKTHILTLTLNESEFFSVFTDAKASTIVTRDDGQVLFSEMESIPLGSVFTKTEATDTVSFDGIRYMLAGGAIELPALRFYYLIPYSDVVVDTDNILTTTLMIAITTCFISLLVSFLFSSSFSRVLSRLLRTIDRVESGDLSVTLASSAHDELGELTRRFANMLQKLGELIEENTSSRLRVKDAELRVLQSQINPHFLYNTLSMINWKALDCGANEVSKAVLTLSAFYRTALNRGENITTVEQELRNVCAYVDLRLMMIGERFDVEYDVCEDCIDCAILKLVLQPIVENAIDHGIAMLSDRRGKINISLIDRDDCFFSVAVSDNGQGMTNETAHRILCDNSPGYGIKNVNERLLFYFGAESGLHIHSTPGEGTLVYFYLPKSK